MKKRMYRLPVLLVLSMLLAVFPGSPATLAQQPVIAIDGVKDAAWGDPLASDPVGDMAEPNLDLQGLYVVEDADNYYIGFDATASDWGMTYGIYLDTDQVESTLGDVRPELCGGRIRVEPEA